MKKALVGLGAAGALAVGLWALWSGPLLLSDIREAPVGDAQAARALLHQAHTTHGGLDAWRAHDWVELDLDGDIPKTPARWGFGVAERATSVTVRFRPTAEVLAVTVDGADRYPGDDRAHFLGQSVQHLFELPFAMESADVLQAYGEQEGHQRIFASWGTAEPQRRVDQYILWRDAEGRISDFQSTGRAITPFLRARVSLDQHREFEGFLLPTSVTVESDPAEAEPVMRWILRGVRMGPASAG